MRKPRNRVKTCDPKYYGKKVVDTENNIRGFDKLLEKIDKEKKNGNQS